MCVTAHLRLLDSVTGLLRSMQRTERYLFFPLEKELSTFQIFINKGLSRSSTKKKKKSQEKAAAVANTFLENRFFTKICIFHYFYLLSLEGGFEKMSLPSGEL